MIIKSILDTDLYKLTMQQVVLALSVNGPIPVEYAFRCRTPGVDLRPIAGQVRSEIENLAGLSLEPGERAYLETLGIFEKPYLDFLQDYRFDPRAVDVTTTDALGIRIRGSWLDTILFEIPILAIVNEVFNKSRTFFYPVETGWERLLDKIDLLNKKPIRLMEFGTRRRYSQEWQLIVARELQRQAGMQHTSNVLLGKQLGLYPVGTMAHEYLQAFQGTGIPLETFQHVALSYWQLVNRGRLCVALTDVISTDAFLASFPYSLASTYQGVRHDSGDPIVWGEKIIAHYEKLGIDPRTKTAVFSDSLTVPKAQAIQAHFEGRINCTFGIGTNLTNDVGCEPLNIVIKMVSCNNRPVAKISDEPAKAVCEDAEHLANIKRIFNIV